MFIHNVARKDAVFPVDEIPDARPGADPVKQNVHHQVNSVAMTIITVAFNLL